jgi:hypothetical protein
MGCPETGSETERVLCPLVQRFPAANCVQWMMVEESVTRSNSEVARFRLHGGDLSPSPKSFARLQIGMSMPCGRKRFGGEGRVRATFLHVALLKSPLIRPDGQRWPCPCRRGADSLPRFLGRRDNTAQLQNWRFGLVFSRNAQLPITAHQVPARWSQRLI